MEKIESQGKTRTVETNNSSTKLAKYQEHFSGYQREGRWLNYLGR